MNFREKLRRILANKTNLYLQLFGIIFLVYLAGITYSQQTTGETGALFTVQVKLSLLFFPILIGTIDFEALRKDIFRKIGFTFVTGCLISSIIILNNAVFHYFTEHTSKVFFYTRLAMVHHPSYLSLLFSFAIALIICWLLFSKDAVPFKKTMAFALIFYFQVFIVLLSSKAGIIGLMLLYMGIVTFSVFRIRKNIRMPVILSTIMMVVFVVILISTPPTWERFYAAEKAVENIDQSDSTTTNGSVARMLIWESSLEIIRKHPLIGVGPGDVRNALVDKYNEKGITLAAEKEYNAHDQYLQTYLAVGLPGFIILCGMLILGLLVGWKRNSLIYFLLVLLFAFHILVESMLERQAGVVFYAFFNALLFYLTMSRKTDSSKFQFP